VRQEGEGLPVAEVETLHAHGAVEIVFGDDRVAAVNVGIEAVEVEKLGRGGERGAAEKGRNVIYCGLSAGVGNGSGRSK